MQRFILILLSCIALSAQAQVVINEYSAANVSQTTDNYGKYEDWVELYNTSASVVNLGGYYLSDNAANPTKWAFPAGVSIPANGFLKIYCTGRDEFVSSNVHTSFKLTQTKPEEIVLSNPGGAVMDQVTMIPNQPNHSHGRTTDGATTWSVFTNPTTGLSNNTSTPYQEYEPRPVFNQAPGFYPSTISLTLTAGAGSTIYYTIDGTTPTTGSTVYSAPITIAVNTVVRAMAVSSNPAVPKSFVETNSYFINSPHTLAVVSVSGDQIETLLGGSQINPDVCMEYFDATGTFRTETSGSANEHGNDSWAYSQRGFDFIAHDEYGISRGWLWKIFNRKSRDDFQRVIMKPAANDNYPFENGGAHIRDAYVHTLSQYGKLHLDERTWEPCVLYVDAKYWGVYEIREKVDDKDFLSYYNNQDELFNGSPNYIQYLKTWGGTWSEYGGAQAQNDWNTLLSYITSNNMAVQANYDYVDSLYNVKSLVDYMILNSYVVCSDWLNWNTSWWRGLNPAGDKKKWRYALWDMDATFGHYINYTGIPSQAPNADPCAPEGLGDPGGQGHVPILNALLANQGFHDYYINRFIDLNNTSFTCTNMLNLLDSMITLITPEMQGQVTKWGGSVATWQNNVQNMRNFITARCDSITAGLMSCYSLTGPYTITYQVDPPGSGYLEVNSLTLDANLPFTGTYFGGIPTSLKAFTHGAPYVFDHWEMTDSPTPSTEDSSVTVNYSTSQTVTAVFKIPNAVFVPTAFSPNGDGINDELFVLGEGIKTLNFSIYDRWGNRLFNCTDQLTGWDGNFKGQKMSSGVYAYKLYAVLTDGTELKQGGNITLVR